MPRTGRPHRLPLHQRLDYSLIPAPLDLSLPLATEKSPLPAIIVTPSSPSSSHDFSIAFLAPPSKPSIRERLSSFTKVTQPFCFKARTVIILFIILLILVCHVVTHRLAARRPYLEFNVQGSGTHATGSPFGSWLDLTGFWVGDIPEDKRDFVVIEIAT